MSDEARPRPEPEVIAAPLVVRERFVAPVPPHRPSDRTGDVGLIELAQVFYRRRWAFCAIVGACVAAAVLFNVLATPLYQTRARILIELSAPEVTGFRSVVAEDQGRFEYYQTQIEMLKSRSLAERTLARLEVADMPEEHAQAVFETIGSLAVNPVNQSRLVDVWFTSTDPELAARVANAHVEAYAEQHQEFRLEAGRQATEWLVERLGSLRQEVDTRESALHQYREDTDAVSLEERQNIVVQKLAQLSTSATTARADRIAKETLYTQVQALRSSGGALDTFPLILSNTFIQGQKSELAALQAKRTQLGEQLGPLHPDMIEIEAAIASAQRRLDAEIDKVVEGIHNDYRAAQANERGLLAALEEQKTEVFELSRASIGYGALRRDATTSQQIFESVLQRFKEAELSGELPSSSVRIVDPAVAPGGAVWPRTYLNLLIALFGGVFLGGAAVVGLEYLRTGLDTPGDIGEVLGLPVLGITPRVVDVGRSAAGVDTRGLPPAFQEALRGIRTQILLSPFSGDVRTIAVTSASPGEGKTSVASNLAISMALARKRVLLVDADLRRPRLHSLFRVAPSPGLSDVIVGEAKISAAMRETAVKGLFVLPTGTQMDHPADLLDSERFRRLIHGLGSGFDIVILDSPPVLAVADASIIANAASNVLFVVGAGTTNRQVARLALERLAAANAQVIGVVMNKADLSRHPDYYYPYFRREDAAYYGEPVVPGVRRPARTVD